MANTFLAPPPRGVAALVSVSDDKIQITILILRRDALSSKDGIEDEDGRRANLWDYQVETAGLESFIEIGYSTICDSKHSIC